MGCCERRGRALSTFSVAGREGPVQSEGQGDIPHLSDETRPHTCDIGGGGAGTRPPVDRRGTGDFNDRIL